MDTKLKKFDKLSLIRFVCIVMSLVFIMIATTKVLGFVSYLEDNEAYDDFADILENYFSGAEIKSENIFRHEYNVFIDEALGKGLLYTSDSDKGYKEYIKKCTDRYGEDFINALLYNRQLGTDYLIFYSLDKGYINLNKIDDINYNPSSSFFYEDGTGYREIYSEDFSYSFEFPEDFDFSYDGNHETTTYEESAGGSSTSSKIVHYRSDNLSYADYAEACFDMQCDDEYPLYFNQNNYGTKYHSDISFTNENLINSSKADALVMIEDAYFGKTHYSGIYEVTLNSDKLDVFSKENFVETKTSFEHQRKEYSDACKNVDTNLAQYKNAFYAVLDESTGRFSTNLTSAKKEVTPENVEKLMMKISPDYIKYSSGVYSHSDSKLSKRLGSFINSYSETLSSDSKFTVWMAFDSSLSGGADPFTHVDNSVAITENQLETTLPPVIIGLLGWLICLIALVFMTGRRSYDSDLHMNRFDGIFTILRTAINLGLATLTVFGALQLIVIVLDSLDQPLSHIMTNATKSIVYVAMSIVSLLITDWVLYIARHIKNRSLIKNISVIKLFIYLYKKAKNKKALRIPRDEEYYDFRKKILRVIIPILAITDIAVIIFSFALSDYEGGEFLLIIPIAFAFEFFAVRWFIHYITSVRDIFLSIHNMRTGEDVDYIDKEKMPKSLKAYADDVNSVSEGLSIAVMNATKEQRTKTELITNVSHDLKTPLTSIINYVDLLSKRPIEDEEAKKYIGVLGEKSEKLKKLIEDLVEASKASAGNVAVNLVRMSLHELVSQVVGEYEDDLSRRGLTVYIEEKEGDILVSADSKLSSRVLDNLMINIKKYAMPGTRVYVRIYSENGFGCISVSNISEQQLNIPASELKERFVRGDESRSTEGSGLGLAIAEDFMSLQGGALELSINGDMFTAEVKFVQA